MKLHYLSLTLLSISIAHAADLPNKITFTSNNQIDAANIERKSPRITHILEFNKRDTITQQKFKQLFSNALEKNIPWLIAPTIIIHNDNFIMDYLDMVEVLRTTGYHCSYFSSHKVAHACWNKASLACIKKYYPTVVAHNVVYVCLTKDMSGNFEYFYPTTYTVSNDDNETIYSDISCILAIRLCNDYSQLLPIIHCLPQDDSNSFLNGRKVAWQNTFDKLPIKKQEELTKQYQAQFGKTEAESSEEDL